MPYSFFFKVSPPSFFGLPEGDKTVVPADPKRQFFGPAIDTRTGKIASHGTLSEYRPEPQTIEVAISGADLKLKAHDNFFTLTIDASNLDDAYKKARLVIERLLRLLALDYGHPFDYEGISVDIPAGKTVQWPAQHAIHMFSVTMYNLTELRQRIETAFPRARIEDPRLDKALIYFENGLLLFNTRAKSSTPSVHDGMLLALAYLQLWKAIAAILGEPGSDKDIQSRYRQFGFPADFWKTRVEPLYRVRNDEDVAHYTIRSEMSQALSQSFPKAVAVCQEVIRAYAEHAKKK